MQLLKELYETPGQIESGIKEELILALATQGKLSAFSCEARQISGMSLNTQKLVAEEELPGGFAALNARRKATKLKIEELEAIEARRNLSSKRETIPWYKQELKVSNATIDQLTDELFTMSQRLDEVVAFAYDVAAQSGQREYFSKVLMELTLKFKSTETLKAQYPRNSGE